MLVNLGVLYVYEQKLKKSKVKTAKTTVQWREVPFVTHYPFVTHNIPGRTFNALVYTNPVWLIWSVISVLIFEVLINGMNSFLLKII